MRRGGGGDAVKAHGLLFNRFSRRPIQKSTIRKAQIILARRTLLWIDLAIRNMKEYRAICRDSLATNASPLQRRWCSGYHKQLLVTALSL